jgi:hypothetical protein
MTAQIAELEKILAQQLIEHRSLLTHVDQHLGALRTLRFDVVQTAATAIEQSRTRVVMLEVKRRAVMQQLSRLYKLPLDASLQQVAETLPQHRGTLMKLRDQLKQITADIARKTTVSSRVSGAMLGHLNTVVRLIAGAMQQASVYTRQGVPTVAGRIGVMEAVG